MDANLIYNRIKLLQKNKNLSNRRFCELAGVSHSVLDNWKKREAIPSVPILEDLCAVVGISVSQLLACDDRMQDLPAEIQRLLGFWNVLTMDDKKMPHFR